MTGVTVVDEVMSVRIELLGDEPADHPDVYEVGERIARALVGLGFSPETVAKLMPGVEL